jgi:hypothetical protein
MLHALPELLDALEAKLIAGDDPLPLLMGVRWSELVGWPENLAEVQALKLRIRSLDQIVQGLHAPLRAAMTELQAPPVYGPSGSLPGTV